MLYTSKDLFPEQLGLEVLVTLVLFKAKHSGIIFSLMIKVLYVGSACRE